jgi:hypothetical protein
VDGLPEPQAAALRLPAITRAAAELGVDPA